VLTRPCSADIVRSNVVELLLTLMNLITDVGAVVHAYTYTLDVLSCPSAVVIFAICIKTTYQRASTPTKQPHQRKETVVVSQSAESQSYIHHGACSSHASMMCTMLHTEG
jgi:hypothetical protein